MVGKVCFSRELNLSVGKPAEPSTRLPDALHTSPPSRKHTLLHLLPPTTTKQDHSNIVTMLAISSHNATQKLTPHLLPCTIHHNGPVTVAQRHWEPQETQSPSSTSTPENGPHITTTDSFSGGKTGTQMAYFRGRKLKGRDVKLPKGYRGMVVEKDASNGEASARPGEKQHLRQKGDDRGEKNGDDDDDEAPSVPVHKLQQTAVFDRMVIWNHETIPGDDDVYIRGLNEWIDFAETVSCIVPSPFFLSFFLSFFLWREPCKALVYLPFALSCGIGLFSSDPK